MNTYPEAVFTKPEAPRSSWEIVKWLFFEPSLLSKYGRTLSRRETSLSILKVYCYFIIPIALILYVGWTALLAGMDMPKWSPETFRFSENQWDMQSGFYDKWFFLLIELIRWLAVGLAFGLAMGLAVGLVAGLVMGLAMGLALGLAFGLAYGLAVGLAAGLAAGLALVLATGLATGLTTGLATGLTLGMMAGLTIGLAASLTFVFVYFRLIIYPFYLFGILRQNSLTNNPYIHDEGIWLTLPWVKNTLRRQANQEPELAFQFVDFLLRYRKQQFKFAAELEHIATAARWKSALRLNAALFSDIQFLKEDTPKGWEKTMPSIAWRNVLGTIRDSLRAAENQNAVVLQLDHYEHCSALIGEFEDIHKRESFKGREAYFDVIDHWKKIISNQLIEVEAAVKKVESITTNPYSKGLALTPKRRGAIPLFLDREDIKNELTLKIQTSLAMPTFLIIGQRRVGKTSLLNFLPDMLPPSFVIAALDAQSMSGELSVPKWFREWRAKVVLGFKSYEPEWLAPDDWLVAWDDFATFLLRTAEHHKRRVILVMDEYDEEQGFHGALRQDVKRGEALLARMRSFSQDQSWVVFMFIGATHFSDLPAPNLAKFFVHADIQRIDYLSQSASMQLIERPIQGFELRYEPGVAARIYELTSGHPHLLHSICSDLVDYANLKRKNPVDFEDLEFIIRERTVMKGEMPFTVFWDEFCSSAAMREAVLAIANKKSVDKMSPEVRKLADYGYLVLTAQEEFRLRVPLFEDWVIKYGY